MPLLTDTSDTARKTIRGVFSTDSSHYLGLGTGKKLLTQRIFVFAEEQEDGRILVQRLSRSFMPAGPRKTVTRDMLLANYLPEPSIYLNKVIPVMRRLEETVSRGDKHREHQELFSAEFEYKSALRLDEEHVRATFGLGLTYLERQETENADIVFRKLIRLDAAYKPEHKHLFNDFGIKLRKLKMYDEALKYYFRAFKLCKDDENLLLNMARTLYEKGRVRASRRMLDKALRLNPDFREGRSFLEYLDAEARGEAVGPPPEDAPTEG